MFDTPIITKDEWTLLIYLFSWPEHFFIEIICFHCVRLVQSESINSACHFRIYGSGVACLNGQALSIRV